MSKEVLLQRLKDHINTVVKHYKDYVYGWDVVNEALNEDGTMRPTLYLAKLESDYVTEAFRLAQTASPGTELYYNDYNNEQPAKRAGCSALLPSSQVSNFATVPEARPSRV